MQGVASWVASAFTALRLFQSLPFGARLAVSRALGRGLCTPYLQAASLADGRTASSLRPAIFRRYLVWPVLAGIHPRT